MEPIKCKMPVSDNYDRVGSARCYGVELETDRCDNYSRIDNTYWGTHYDYTCGAEEFVSSILNGNDGLDAVTHLTDFAAENDWFAGSSCGYHLHIDVSTESVKNLKAIALAYQTSYKAWSCFVDYARLNDSYCCHKEDSCGDIAMIKDLGGWRRYAGKNNRYSWVNWNAYSKHGTCEIRSHQGTLDGCQVCNWIRAHTTFVDWAVRSGYASVRAALWCRTDSEVLSRLADIWEEAGCYDLASYYFVTA